MLVAVCVSIVFPLFANARVLYVIIPLQHCITTFSNGFVPSRPAQGINWVCMEKGAALMSAGPPLRVSKLKSVQGARLESAGQGCCEVSGG